MPIDQITQYNTNQPFDGGKEPGGAGGAGAKQLPKDVLEALENEDFEKALLLLKKYEEKEGAGLMGKFAPLQTLAGMFQFLFSIFRPGKEEQIAPSKFAEGSRSVLPKERVLTEAPKKSLFLQAVGMTYREALNNMTRTFQAMFQFFLKPALNVTIVPIQHSIEKVVELSRRVQEAARQGFKGLERLTEPMAAAISRRIEPIQSWTKEKVERLEARVREATAAAFQATVEYATPVVTFALLPLELVKNSANDLKKWSIKKSLEVRPYLQEAADQFKNVVKWAVRLNIRIGKEMYRLAKRGILFLLELLGIFLQLIFQSIIRLFKAAFAALKKIWYGGGGPGEQKPPPPRSPSAKPKR